VFVCLYSEQWFNEATKCLKVSDFGRMEKGNPYERRAAQMDGSDVLSPGRISVNTSQSADRPISGSPYGLTLC
jgi:hypothetical protein